MLAKAIEKMAGSSQFGKLVLKSLSSMLQLKVEAIKWVTADTATFYFTETSGKKVKYVAGQFVTLVFTHHDEEIRRSYSLSSSPDEELLAITVKRIANGEISRFMLTKVKPGDIINAVEPAGRFTITDFQAPKRHHPVCSRQWRGAHVFAVKVYP
jgi:ferredoxin-NADP reductase